MEQISKRLMNWASILEDNTREQAVMTSLMDGRMASRPRAAPQNVRYRSPGLPSCPYTVPWALVEYVERHGGRIER
jgi:hypothetical protein